METTSTSPATRDVDGSSVRAPGTWTLDPGHAEVGFVGRHFMLTKVRGRFTGVEATVHIADCPAASTVTAAIDMRTVASGDHARDEHLRSADFFDVERYPQAQFQSSDVAWSGTRGTLVGDLTIKDVVNRVELAVEYVGHARDPWGADRAIFEAHGQVDRRDWNLTWNMPLDTGGVLVSNTIQIELQIELVREP